MLYCGRERVIFYKCIFIIQLRNSQVCSITYLDIPRKSFKEKSFVPGPCVTKQTLMALSLQNLKTTKGGETSLPTPSTNREGITLNTTWDCFKEKKMGFNKLPQYTLC